MWKEHWLYKEGKVTEMKMVPLEKQSKKAQRKFHSRYRRDWNGVKPTTRVVKSKKIYDRKKLQKPGYDRKKLQKPGPTEFDEYEN